MKHSDLGRFPASWQNTSYQKAIWNARRRLLGKQTGEISEHEYKVLQEMTGPLTKPDYSRWVNGYFPDPGETWVIPNPRKANRSLERSSFHAIPTSNKDQTITSETMKTKQSKLHQSSLPHEFIALSDSAQLHENTMDRTPIDISTAFDRIGLCNGCFHRKGPHQHYQAPVRIGGGYSIYHQNARISNEDLSWSTLKWLSSSTDHRIKMTGDPEQLTGTVYQYSSHLYERFLSKGGDGSALEEYLESNFDPNVLLELEESGVNTNLIQEYSEIYREHIKQLLRESLKKQSDLTKKLGDDVDFATLFSEIESSGTDMNMLMVLLTKGRNDDEIRRFEEMGGNTEILEYYCDEIRATASHEKIMESFERILENDNRHRSAETFMEYVDSGGNLKMLKKFVEQRSLSDLEENDLERKRIEQCISSFPNEVILLQNLELFSKRDEHLYIFARLLQRLIENGGSIRALKYFARFGFNEHVLSDNVFESEKDVKLLQSIGEEFSKDVNLQEDLMEFPDEPYVTEAYIRGGGNFPALVQAMAEALNAPCFEQQVKLKTTETLNKYTMGGETAKIGKLSTPRNSPVPTSSSGVLSLHVLPRLLEKARADLEFDEIVQAEQLWLHNEGQYILKTLKQKTFENDRHISEVDVSERKLVTALYKHSNFSTDGSSVSSITGKKRNRLWNAPRPFEIQRSHILPTRPRSPFTQNRQLRISSLTEDNILETQKRQRNELDLLKRNLRVEDFQKNWHFAITSPRGSIVTANSIHPENLPITTHHIPVETPTPQKKDRVSRRKQQREKLKAIKQEASRSGRNSRQSSPSSERSLSPNILQLPSVPNVNNPPLIPDITVTSQDTDIDPSSKDKDTKQELEEEKSSISTVEIHLPSKVSTIEVTQKETPETMPQVRYATAFGHKIASASSSSISSARELRRLMDQPETMVEAVGAKTKITSKSESAIPSEPPTACNNTTWEELSKKMLRKKVAFGQTTNKGNHDKNESSSDEDTNDDEVLDILKHYCIVREDRVPLYKRIFEKYVLVKSLRDRERNLAKKRKEKDLKKTNEPLDEFTKVGTPKFELGKTRFVLEKIKENIEDLQMEIIATKGEVKQTIATVARRTFADSIEAAAARREKAKIKSNSSVFGAKLTTSQNSENDDNTNENTVNSQALTDKEVLALLTPRMRLQCESQVEVRDRKVTLVHLRDKVKRLQSRQRSLRALCGRLVKQIENEEVEQCMKRKELEPFIRKQSAIFRELHPTDDPAVDECDLRQALAELDPELEFVDNSQLLEGISMDNGITFRVFCVISALHEKRNLPSFDRKSLEQKMKRCKEHYASLLGPNFDVVNADLAAAGITEPQRQQIIHKLSRRGGGGLDILEFVTYVPLFVDVHKKIVSNPLPLTL